MKRGISFLATAVLATTLALVGALAQDAPYFRWKFGGLGSSDPASQLNVLAPGSTYQVRIGNNASIPAPTVTNATGPFTWFLQSGPIPSGMDVSPDGTLSGIPQTPGYYGNVSLRAETSDGRSGISGSYAVSVLGLPTISYVNLTTSSNQNVRLAPNLTYVTGSANYVLESGNLPLGLGLGSGGVISGQPSVTGTFPGIQVRVTDFDGATQVSAPFSIVIQSAPASLVVANATGREDVNISHSFAVSGLTSPVTWSIDQGALPSGIEVDQALPGITGVSASATVASGIVAKGVDANGLTVWSNPFSVTINGVSVAYPTRTVSLGVPASIVPTSQNLLPGTTWVLASGSTLPTGLSLSDTTGAISGTPTVEQTVSNIVVRAIDAGGTYSSAPFNLTVAADSLIVSTPSAMRTRVASPFETTLTASNAVAPVTWSLKTGALPQGLDVEATTGKITGTPTVTTTSIVTLEAVDSIGVKGVSQPVSIQVIPQPAPIPEPVYTLRKGVASNVKVQANYILGNEQWAPTPVALVPGVTMNAQGYLTGTPAQTALVNNVLATVTDSADGATGTSSGFTILVEEPPPAVLSITGVWPTYNVRSGNVVNMANPTAAPAAGPLTWSHASGTLPNGLGIDPSTGRIVGFAGPATYATALRMGVTDGTSTAQSASFSINVTGPLQATVASATGTMGVDLNVVPTLTGRIGNATWSLSGGELPTGLFFNTTTGRISGSPTQSGTFAGLVLTVTDAFDGATAQTQPFTLTIQEGLIVRGPSTLSGKAGVAFTSGSAFTVTGGAAPYTWTFASGAPPAGLGINATTGVISGVPTTEGTTNGLVLRATDANGLSGVTSTFAMTITGNLRVVLAPLQNFTRTRASGFTPAVENAVGTVQWAMESGTLPPGLSFNATNGRISGVPTELGTWGNLRLRATDSTTATAVSQTFTIVVGNGITITLNRNSIVTGRELQSYSLPEPTVVGAVGAVVFDFEPTVPTYTKGSVNLNTSTGAIVGTLPNDSYYFKIRVTDSIGVTATAPGIMFDTTRAVQNDGGGVGGGQQTRSGQVGQSFQFYPGNTYPYVFNVLGTKSFSYASGNMPPWATLDPVTGNITGVPDAPGSWTVNINACDSYDGNCDDAPHNIYITPTGGPGANPFLTGREGKRFLYPNVISPPAGFTLGQGSPYAPEFDPRIFLDSPRSGFDTSSQRPGFWKDFTIRYTKSGSSGLEYGYRYFDIDIANALTMDNRYIPQCVRTGVPFTMPTPVATGIRGTKTFSVYSHTGQPFTLPTGLSMNAQTGVLEGTPTSPIDDANVYLRVTDSWDNEYMQYQIRLHVRTPPSVPATQATITGKTGESIFRGLNVQNIYTAGIARVKSGSLPPGIKLYGSTSSPFYLEGTYEAPGIYSAVVEFEDAYCDGAKIETTLNFNITSKLYAKATDAYARIGVTSRSAPAPTASFGGNPVTWSLQSGTIPPGMTLDSSTGELVGKPTSEGTYNNLRLTASDTTSTSQTNPFKVLVAPGPSIQFSQTRYDYNVNQSVSITPSTVNVIGAMNWTVNGTLPQGVAFNSTTGTISGTAQAVADANLSVGLTDSQGAIATPVQIRIVVDPIPVGTWVADQMLNCVNGDGRFACIQGYSCTTSLCTTPNPSGHVCTTDGYLSGGAMAQCMGNFTTTYVAYPNNNQGGGGQPDGNYGP